MKREPDNNRVKRAMEHLKAAVVSIRSIKFCDRNILEHNELTRIEDLIRFDLMGSLEKLTKEEKQ